MADIPKIVVRRIIHEGSEFFGIEEYLGDSQSPHQIRTSEGGTGINAERLREILRGEYRLAETQITRMIIAARTS